MRLRRLIAPITILLVLLPGIAFAAPGDTTGTTGSTSSPRVMVTGFSTNPGEVQAGTDFTLSYTVKNMSTKTSVDNVVVTVASGEDTPFLPVNGSSSQFLQRIGAGKTADLSIAFRALPTLEERPYQMSIQMAYEAGGVPAESTETIAVMVKQPVRADTTTLQVMPDTIVIGQDANVTFQIINRGKSPLYNASVTLKPDQAVTASEAFVGTIQAGSTGTVDLMVHGERTMEGPVGVSVSFEDAAGAVTTLDKEFTLAVNERAADPTAEDMVVPSDTSSPWASLVGWGLALLALIVGAVLVVRRRRRARAKAEHEQGLEALDTAPLVTPDEPSTTV